jgi:hypothetical protein
MEIDRITFRLIQKIWNGHYTLVQIESEHNMKTTTFYVYPSKSELGVWRFCSYDKSFVYKGATIETENYTYDYVQHTLIHIQLQLYINQHLDALPEIDQALYPAIDPYKDNIDNPNRQLHISPFIWFQKLLQCGEIRTPKESYLHALYGNLPNQPSTLVEAFSKQLETFYSIVPNSIREEHPSYSTYFEYVILLTKVIKSVTLTSPTQQVKLYFLEIKCTKQIDERVKHKIPPEMMENIDKVCSIPLHYMPILLTTPDVTCNELGLYNTYIPCGAFICKLFDYSTQDYIQCTKNEIVCGRVTPKYSYIGSRYLNIFPFNKIRELSMPSKLQVLRAAIQRTRQSKGGKRKRSKKVKKVITY